MPRLSPIHYIAPSAISIVPNANGSYNDIAVYVTRGAKIKVFSPRAGIDMSDNAYQEWSFSGRNRRLADSTVPYTIYARLDRKNRADGYLIFAPQKLVDNEWVDKYPSVTQNGLTKNFYERTTAITKYWFVRLGEVSLPENGQRILTFDTGILDTDDFNTNWSLSPDALPLRVELGCTISDEDAGPNPYIYWGQFLVLSSHLVEGWTGTDIERFDHWEITRNTDDAVADAAWNTGERARTIRDTGVISLRHLRTVDDFNGAVSAIFTITAMERHENPEDPSNPIYAPLVSASINIHAETVEKYELVPSTTIVSYNPQSGAYNPADGVFVRVRATDQSGYVCELTNGQLVNSRITVQYAVADTENWIDVTFGDVPTDTAVGNIPTSAFSAQKNVVIRILGIDASELTSLPISFVRDGEDSKEREWIFFRSVNPVVFVDEPGLHQKPALVNGGEVNPTGAATGEDTNKNQDGWVPENWWDEMQGTDEEHPYEYGSYRDFVRDDNNGNHWGSFSDPKIWSRYAGDAVTYDIVPSVSIINADAAGTIISDGIIVRAYKTKGKERSGNILPPTVGSNYFAEYSIDGGAWTRCAMFDYQPEGEQAVHVYGIAPEYVEQAGVNIALRLKSSDDVSEVLKEVSPIEVVRIVSEEETQAIVEQYGDAHYFRKDQQDVDPHLATFGDVHVEKGLPNGDGTTSEGNLEVDENANIGGTLDVNGKFTANDVAEIKKMLTLLEGVKSNDYVDDDPVGKGGWMITNKDEHGNSYMVIDKLFVRLKAIFNELEIRKLSYAGGNITLSHAGSKVVRVSKIYEGGIEYQDYIIELDDSTWHDRGIYISDLAGAEYDEDNRCVILPNAHLVPNPVPPPPESSVIAYRCYLLKDDGTTATENWWRVDDQAKCQTFNIVEPGTYQNAENTYYWRLVTGIGTKVLEDGMTYDYIDLSKDDHDDATTDIPKEGDELVQMGNRTDTERQGFIALEVTGEYAPALMLYKGVNGYSLNGKRKIIISPKLTEFIVNKWVQETDYGVFPQTKERGDWSDITPDEQGNRKCYYYDLVQHNGASWLCITGNEYTTDEPSENSAAWRVYAQKGVKGDKGDSITKSSADTYRYATNNTGVRPEPSSSDWQTTKPAIQKGYWLYVETTIHWSDGTTTVIYNDERNPNDGVPGQDIIVDGATVMRYCCNQSSTTHPAEDSTEWKTLDQVTQRQGWWLWSQATTFYRKSSSSEGSHDAGKSVSYNVNYIAEDGDTPEAARGISSITEYYKATNSNTPLPAPSSDTGWDTDPNLSHLQDKWDADHIYLWNYEKVTYSKAPLVERTIPQILAIWTKDGETGRGIDSITNKYKVTTTSVAPAREHEGGTGWSNTPVAPAKGEYLWNYEIVAWTKGTTPTYTDVQQIGYAGTDGSSITKTAETPYYIKNTTGVRPAENDPNWNTTKPTVGKGEWLFTKTVITWSDNSKTVLFTDERNPNDGASGQDIVVDGDTVIKYAVSSTNTTAPTQWYNYSEIVSQIVPGKWLWSKATTYYRKSGSASGSHDAGSSSNTNVSYIGINGTSVSVDANNSKTQYAVSTSPTVTPSSWQDTMPNVPQGQYLWTKVTTAFTDGNSTVSYGVSYRGIDGDDVQIDTSRTYVRYSTVKTASQPADSTFTRTTPPDLSEGDYLWSLSQTAYVGVTNVLKSYSVSRLGIDGEEGQRGPDGYTTHFAYATSADGSQNFSTTNFAGATYIGTYKDDKSADSQVYTDYVWTAWKGAKGANGRALTASSEHYNVSNSSSTQWNVPSSGTWAGEWTTDPNVPNQQGETQWGENNRYLWNYEKVTYTESDGTTTIARTTPKVIAIWTKDGAEGRGIDSITNMYAIGDNPLTPPVSGWDDEPMAPTSENPFLWNYEIISWTKGTPATTETTKHVIGRFGSDSASLYIENPNIYIPVDKDGKVSTADGQPFVARVPFYAIAGSRALAHYSAELDEDSTVDYCTFGGQGAYDPTDNIFKRTGDEVSIEGAYVDGRGIVLPNSIVFAPSDVIITIPNNSVLDEHSAYVTLTALDSQGGQYTVFGAIVMRGRVLAKTPDEPMQAFQWNGSATVAPSPLPSGANLGNWSASAPNRPAGEKFLWMTQTVRHTAYNGDVTYDNWSQATRISGDKGTPGEDASDTEWIYTRNDTGVTPDTPTSPTQAGWTDHPQGVTSSLKYEYASFRRKPAGNNQQWGAFQPPILWSHYGRNGIDGDGVEYVYARTKDATAPAVPQSGTYSEENNNYDVDEHLPYVRVLSSKDISGSTTPVTSGAYKYAKCTDDPVGVDDTWKYEWVLKRSKTSPDASGNRNWDPYSGDSVNHKMSEWANYAEKGDKGADAVNVIVTPASLIVNQDMETLTNLSNLTEAFVVQVKIGETSQTVNNIFFKSEQNESNYYKLQFLKNGGTSGGEGTINGSTLTLKAINTYEKDGEDYYYDHAYADLVITYNTNKTINARINVYANLLGGWAHKLQGDLQEDIATMKFYFKDENGNVVAYETIGDYIKSSTENVTTLQQKTNGTITAMSELAQTANSVSMKVYEGVLPKDLFSHSDSVQDYSITNNYESLPVITNTTQFKTFTASLPMTHRVKNRAGEVLTDGTLRFRVFKNGESGYCFLAVIRLENGKVASESYSPATTFNGKVKASFTVVDTYTVEGQGDNVNGTYVRGVLSFEASIDDGFTTLDFQVRRDTTTAIATILKERTLIGSLSVKDGLKATGIDIEKGKIINRANQWEVWNLADERTAWIDDMGNFTIRGVYNNLITIINESNWDKYIIKDQSGRYSHWYLDVLLCGSFIVIESLPADVISEFNAADDGILHLPYYANDNYFSRGYTRYLASSDSDPRLMTDNELRMLAGRKFVIKWNAFPNIANNRALGPIYRPEVYYGGTTTIERLDSRLRDLYAGERHCISINPLDTTVNRSPVLNVPRTFFMSFNLVKFHTNQSDSDYSWGYIWMADDDSGSAAKDDINWT